MNGYFLFFVAFFQFVSVYCYSQSTAHENYHKTIHDFFITTIQSLPAAKTTGTDSRIIAIGQSRFNGTVFNLTDSTHLFYSGARGGDYTRQLKYDSLYTFLYNASLSGYVNSRRNYQTFDGKDNLLSRQIQTWSNNSWNNLSLNQYAYDNNNNQTSSIIKTWNTNSNLWDNTDSSAFAYDAAGNLILNTSMKWNQNSWVNYSQTLYAYNSGNALTSATYKIWSQGIWKDTLKDIYSFDANSFLIAHKQQIFKNGLWEDTLLLSYMNDANGNILTQTLQKMSQNNWVNVSKAIYTYNSNNKQTSGLNQSWNNSTQSWDTVSGYSLGYDGNNNLVKEEYQSWNSTINSLVNTKRFRHTYNSFNQVTETWRDTWSTNTATWEYAVNDQASRYHYELFTSILSVAANTSTFKVYPSPAHDYFIIEAVVAAPCSIILSDIFGRILKHWDFKNHLIKQIVLTDGFAPGYYNIILVNSNEKIAQKIPVIK